MRLLRFPSAGLCKRIVLCGVSGREVETHDDLDLMIDDPGMLPAVWIRLWMACLEQDKRRSVCLR